MTMNDPSVPVFGSVHFYVSFWKNPKIQNGERPPYRKSFLAVFFSYSILGFDKRRLSYRLRYICNDLLYYNCSQVCQDPVKNDNPESVCL